MNKKIFFTVISLTIILTGCGQRSYDSKPNITPEVRVKAEADLEKYSKVIAEFQPKVSAVSTPAPADKPQATPATPTPESTDSGKYPPLSWYLNKSTAESTLGQNDAAITTLNKALIDYPNEIPLLNNMGRIYDGADDCGKAEAYYTQILKRYKMPQYYYDTALCYMRAKDKENTIKNYDAYKKVKPNFSDEEIDDFLSK